MNQWINVFVTRFEDLLFKCFMSSTYLSDLLILMFLRMFVVKFFELRTINHIRPFTLLFIENTCEYVWECVGFNSPPPNEMIVTTYSLLMYNLRPRPGIQGSKSEAGGSYVPKFWLPLFEFLYWKKNDNFMITNVPPEG